MMHSNVTLHTLMERNRWVEDVLRWHGVDPEDVDRRMSVRALCWAEGIDPRTFVQDLYAVGAWEADEFDTLVPEAPVVSYDIDDEYEVWEQPVEDDLPRVSR